MKSFITLLTLKVILTTGAFVLHAKVDFNTQIRPILSDKCFKCHGPDAKNQKSDFRLDSFEEANKEHDGFVGLTPGNLEDSEIHWRIRSDDPLDMMPTPESKISLSEEEKDLLDQWIKEGGKYEKHWSFLPLAQSIPLPKTKHPYPGNEIDAFIAEKLESSKLSISEETDRNTWLRRVTFDLTGLPPTLKQLNEFSTDTSTNAYEKVVERLLNTDEYAERMTSEWLDVARYSDTYGYQVDRNRNVWQWRDWVIQSFVKNQSYDQFVTEQLAGDLIPNATRDQILATCFNRLHPQKVEGGSVPEEFRIEYVADRVHTFGTAFLGLSFECTRCHDHKYDPITQKDYFSLSAFFNNIDEAGLYSFMTGSVPTPTLELGNLPSDKKIKAAKNQLEEIVQSLEAKQSYDNWTKEVSLKSIGSAPYFSKNLQDTNSSDSNFDLLTYKPMLWLDANEQNASSSIWLDQSGNKNHAKKYASPKTMPHPASGLMVMSYDSKKNDYHEFKEINNIRTVFWIMSKKVGNSGSPLAHATTHHFYSDGSKFWHPQHTHEHIRSGSLRLNGLAGSSHSNYPSSLGIVSLRTTGNVTASRLGKDRNHGGKYNWDGEIGELLIFSEPLTDEHIQKIENHLITKWKIKKKTEIRYGAPVA